MVALYVGATQSWTAYHVIHELFDPAHLYHFLKVYSLFQFFVDSNCYCDVLFLSCIIYGDQVSIQGENVETIVFLHFLG